MNSAQKHLKPKLSQPSLMMKTTKMSGQSLVALAELGQACLKPRPPRKPMMKRT
jgi:hypothetical protein